ncbi:Guanine nucleotide-binding protein alpha-1 subunit [Lobaria immixta]|nr:Guanine nucleotide-binding protein alpha-1 subunit [Lobaria immixta]
MEWEPFGLDLALAIRALWSDSGVREYFKRWERRQWVTSCSYYFDSINRIALPDYAPTDQDILRIWVNTICYTSTDFTIENLTWRVFDVGGLRSERKKWVHVFEDVAVLIYLVDISAYDQCLYEDESANMTQESLVVFEAIRELSFFAHTSIVLFFTKIGCLEGKLATSPIKKYIHDFSNDPNSPQDVKDYFERKFLSLNKNPQRTIDVYFTSLVSKTGPGRTAFAAIEQALRLRKGKSGDKVKKII